MKKSFVGARIRPLHHVNHPCGQKFAGVVIACSLIFPRDDHSSFITCFFQEGGVVAASFVTKNQLKEWIF